MIYGAYSPLVTLGATWREDITFVQDDGAPLDLTGAHVVAHLHAAIPRRSGSAPSPAPVLELCTPGFRATPPAFPSIEGWSVPTPTNGRMLLEVAPEDFWVVSPTNLKRKLRWSIMLAFSSGVYIPVVQGKVGFLVNTTVLT